MTVGFVLHLECILFTSLLIRQYACSIEVFFGSIQLCCQSEVIWTLLLEW